MNADLVSPWAAEFCKRLEPTCQKVDIAGSLRRGKADVKDIEIVALPVWDEDLFGGDTRDATALTALLEKMTGAFFDADPCALKVDEQVKRQGPRYKRFITGLNGMVVEIFMADEDNYGNILTIRTGDSDFSRLLVTSRTKGGAMPEWMVQRDGYLWRWGERVSCPTEPDYFAALGLPWIEPARRTGEYLARMLRSVPSTA